MKKTILLIMTLLLISSVNAYYPYNELDREALRFRSRDPFEVMDLTVDFVYNNLEYEPNYNPKGLYRTWNSKKGDCTDYSQMIVYLLRQNGLDAYTVHGYLITPEGKRLKHDWVEVKITWEIDPLSWYPREKIGTGVW